MTTQQYPTAQITEKSRFSLIWIVPLLAALIAGWLVFKYYSERGTIVEITFDSAEGIEAKKTPIRYKDVQVGKVKKLSLTPDLKKVTVTAEIFPEMASHLNEGSRFWIEKPRVTLKGISGLDTLLSGVHISLDPGEEDFDGEILDHYEGLASPPTFTSGEEGTLLTVNTKSLGSLSVGSPVYFHQIDVGEVTGYEMNRGYSSDSREHSVDISIYIRAPFDKNIQTNTRFWNTSGLELNLTTSGVSVQMESLTSLLIGGIAFETPDDELGYPLDGNPVAFKLYDSSKLAKDDTQRLNKLFYLMYFDDTLHGLGEDSLIKYHGVQVGKVEQILLESSNDGTELKTLVKVSLRVDKFSEDGSQPDAEKALQHLVKQGMHGQLEVDSLITGSQYISLAMLKPDPAKEVVLDSTSSLQAAIFPTTGSKTSLLNFDASEISGELTKTLEGVTALLESKDVKRTLKGLASTSESIDKMTRSLEKKGFSGEIVKTLAESQKAIKDISALIGDTRKSMVSITNATNKLQKDASHSLQTFSNVSNKLQRDTSKTLATVDKSLNSTMSEDSALQYRLQQLINNLSEASNSFSVLADTIQRKPNSVILGK